MLVTLPHFKFARPPCCCYWQEMEKYGFGVFSSAIVLVLNSVDTSKLFGRLNVNAVTD